MPPMFYYNMQSYLEKVRETCGHAQPASQLSGRGFTIPRLYRFADGGGVPCVLVTCFQSQVGQHMTDFAI